MRYENDAKLNECCRWLALHFCIFKVFLHSTGRPRVRGAAGMAQRGLLREGRSARQRRAAAEQEGISKEGIIELEFWL